MSSTGSLAARLVFVETKRSLPSLNRGWRTPDPSPTRDAAGLPGWELEMCIENCEQEDASTTRGRSTTSPSIPVASRTPSPSAMRQHLPLEKVQVNVGMYDNFDDSFEDEIPTPRMQLPSVTLQPVAISYNLNTKATNASQQTLEAKPLKAPKPEKSRVQETILAASQQKLEAKSLKVPKPEKSEVQEKILAAWLPGGFGKLKATEMCAEMSGECPLTVSIGSVGHPHTCAEACKFVLKKRRGCKDGAACSRCHLCKWVKKSSSKPKGALSMPPPGEQSAQDKQE